MDVGIMGAGIDGLLAAHAVARAGHHPVIFSDEGEDYTTHGARYLRGDIPGITDNMQTGYMQTQLDSAESLDLSDTETLALNYIRKVYGADVQSYVQYPLQELEDMLEVTDTEIPCYSPNDVQQKLQDLYKPNTEFQWVTPEWYKKTSVRHDFDVVINTLPIPKWCMGQTGGVGHHRFPTAYYYVSDNVKFGPMHKNKIMLNGDPDVPHYLSANLFGEWVVEWPESRKPPYGNPKRIARPLESICDCDSRFYDFTNIGQFGLWDHREPIRDSYTKVYELMCKDEPKQLDLGI